jgi:hypothetical protein
MRSGRLSFDQLVSELARARQPDQLLAKLRSIVESLPLPDTLPPARIEGAERIDSGRQLRALGKKWGNCLESYVWNVEHGQCAIYLWQHAGLQATCSVTRCGRLGWFLDEVKGPQNTDLERQDLDKIFSAFERANPSRIDYQFYRTSLLTTACLGGSDFVAVALGVSCAGRNLSAGSYVSPLGEPADEQGFVDGTYAFKAASRAALRARARRPSPAYPREGQDRRDAASRRSRSTR